MKQEGLHRMSQGCHGNVAACWLQRLIVPTIPELAVPKIDYDADEFFRFLELQSLLHESGSRRLAPSDDQEYQRLLGKYGVAPLDAVPVDPANPACIPRGDAILSINCKPIPGFRALICPRSQP